jgi:FkbM family methyltransferase
LGRLGLVPLTARARRLVARLTGDRFSVNLVNGATIGGSLIQHGTYLGWLSRGGPYPFELELFTDAVGPGMQVVDCGAHIGLFSVLAARRVGPRGNVVALEPYEPNLDALRANLEDNGVADRVEVVDAAASDRSGAARLYLDRRWSTDSSLSPRPGMSPTEMRCVTLDEVLAGRPVDVAKIDVEGAETLVLRGMSETLARSPGAVVFIECHPPALGGTKKPLEWLPALRDAGSLELIDEKRRRLVAATDDEISRLARDIAGRQFNVRWTVGEVPAKGP